MNNNETFAIDNLFTDGHKDEQTPNPLSNKAPFKVSDDTQRDIERGGFAANISVTNDAVIAALRSFDYELDDVPLLYLVPLVRTAWAEGVVTRRERRLILEAARQHGIAPGSRACEKLSGWLDFEPTEEFYKNSFSLLGTLLHSQPSDESELNRWNIVDLCAHIAGTSGGSPSHVGGGRRICDEEVEMVKSIAAELSEASRREASGWLNIAVTTGITDVSVLRDLHELGYTAETARMLPLIPLIEMAWAEGSVTKSERRIITNDARLRGIRSGSPAYERVTQLLDTRPSDDFFERSFRAVMTTFEVLPSELREVDECDLLSFCERVAGASSINSDFSDFNNRICDEERELLNRFSAKLSGTHPLAVV